MTRTLFVLAAVFGVAVSQETNEEWKARQEDVAKEAAAVQANEAKKAAVDKVIAMLESLRTQVLDEGESESQTYNKFACFCKDTTADKTAAISRGEDEKGSLASKIEEYSSARTTLDEAIAQFNTDITDAEARMKAAEAERADTLALYTKNDADLKAALDALSGAIASLKSSKSPSLAQIRAVQKTIRTAALLADALGIQSKANVAFLLQEDPENDVPMEDYKFHSDGIIETLEKLMADFRTEKNEVDAAEVESTKLHDALMQEGTDLVKRKTMDLGDAQKAKAKKSEEIASATQRRTTVAATLLDDQQYLMELSSMCADKAATWDQRTGVRQDELSTLTSAIEIIKGAVSEKTSSATLRLAQEGVSARLAEAVAHSPQAMEEIEAEAEAAENAPVSFVQELSSRTFMAPTRATGLSQAPVVEGREKIAELLRKTGKQLKSTLLTSLASQVENIGSEDVFAKVKVLIQELIDRLLTEASNESNQKGWCDKATADATQKRTYASAEVEELNAQMAELEATRNKLIEEMLVLTGEIADLETARAEATDLRTRENTENAATVTEATAGLDAVSEAIDILSKFYKTKAKETVALAQQGPADDAPDAGFKNFEAYKGAQSESGGIIGMLDVIKSDFGRTISETQKAEAEAEQDHLKFMTDTGKSLKEKTVANAEKTKQKDSTVENLQDADDSLQSQMTILATSISELLELKPACIDTGMSYNDRVANREDEIAALKKALCILGAYAAYGPDGAGDAC